jgi:hypothetical protein
VKPARWLKRCSSLKTPSPTSRQNPGVRRVPKAAFIASTTKATSLLVTLPPKTQRPRESLAAAFTWAV